MEITYKFIDLFAGMGGFRIAFENQGCKCVFSSEIDNAARETYKLNFGEYPSESITNDEEYRATLNNVLQAFGRNEDIQFQ